MAAVPSPAKPWEIRRQQNLSSSASALPTTSATASTNITNTPALTNNSTMVPPRPNTPSSSLTVGSRPWESRYSGGYSPYSNYGSSYGSNYGSSYGSSYSPYSSRYGSSYGSGYGGYGSGYGGYGSYGSSYGSGYGGYGSGYGGYGSYGSYGGYRGGYGDPYGQRYGGPTGVQGVLDSGYRGFGEMAEGFSRFSRLLDANFDAMHGSFASVLRLLDVAGEFLHVFKTFAAVQFFFGGFAKIGRLIRWLLFGYTPANNNSKKLVQGGKNNSPLEFTDYQHYQQDQTRQKMLPLVLIVLGFALVGAPMLLMKLLRLMKRHQVEGPEQKGLEDAWNPANEDPNQPPIGQALSDFRGNSPMELSFNKDDQILILSKPYPDWWEGEIQLPQQEPRRGLFPANFVKILKPNKVEVLPEDPNTK